MSERQQVEKWRHDREIREEERKNRECRKKARIIGIIVGNLLRIQDDLYLTEIMSADELYDDYKSIYNNTLNTYNMIINTEKIIRVHCPELLEKFIKIRGRASIIRNQQRVFYCHVLKNNASPYESDEWRQICENSILLNKECGKLLDILEVY